MGNETQKVFERKQTGTVYADVRRPYPDGSSDRGGRSSGENDGQARSSDDGAGGRNGEAESNGSDGMGTPPELDREQSGGNNSERADLRIKQNKLKQPKTEEQSVSPVFSSFSVCEQMSLFFNTPRSVTCYTILYIHCQVITILYAISELILQIILRSKYLS